MRSSLTEDGRRREVLRVSKAIEPIDIALLVDNSTAARTSSTDLRMALAKFVARMAPANQIAVISPGRSPDDRHRLHQRSQEAGQRGEGVLRCRASGMTLLDALIETSKGLAKRESPRAVIVAGQYDRRNRVHQLLLARRRQGDDGRECATALVGIGRFICIRRAFDARAIVPADRRPAGNRRTAIDLLSDAIQCDQALERLARELSSQYKVVYGRPESLIPPRSKSVVVTRRRAARVSLMAADSPERGTADTARVKTPSGACSRPHSL